MTLAPGTRLNFYEVLAPLGAGAMGEVWRARDTRLGREVAIKALPEAFVSDPERLRRFEREAQTLAALNHPNVAQIFGVDQVGDTCFLVLELVEGQSLDERLKRGPLPVDEAIDLCREIAAGLEAAHEAGVIHRDLKPANVRVTPAGKAKVLDFGLAKPMRIDAASAGPPGASSNDSVLTTEAGRLLGTPTYMAPEQARGRPIDKRVDIWAFGCVLYECLTARRTFTGESMTDVLAAVLQLQPDFGALPAATPRSVRELLARCLEKDPQRRLRDIGEARLMLERAAASDAEAAAGAGGAMHARGATSTATAAWTLAALSTIVAVIAITAWLRAGKSAPASPAASSAAALPVVRTSLTLPADLDFAGGDGSLALSPDGRVLALVAARGATRNQIWLRPLDSLQPQPLIGTEDARYPFWSPDGLTLAFFSDGKLRRVPATGGTVTTLCDARDPRGGSWGPDGTIIFAPVPFGPLMRVSATGGTPVAVTQTEGQVSHRLPHVAPDGRHVVYSQGPSGADGLLWLDLQTGVSTRIADGDSEGFLVGSWLAFVRSRALMLQPFDAVAGKLLGEPRRLVDRVEFLPPRMTGAFTLSAGGSLVYRADPPSERLEWFDVDGRSLGQLGDPSQFVNLALSPDGTRVAALRVDDDGRVELWTLDARGLGARQAVGAAGVWLCWSPDGRQLAYCRDNGTEGDAWIHDVDGSDADRWVGKGMPGAWSPDGQWLAVTRQTPDTDLDAWCLRVDGSAESTTLATTASERAWSFSPDSRWLLASSDQSGREELYAAPIDGSGPAHALTSCGYGGRGAWWLADNRVVFLSHSGRELLEISVTPRAGGGFDVSEARPGFRGRELPASTLCPTADFTRLLAVVPGEEGGGEHLTLVQNWPAAIEGR